MIKVLIVGDKPSKFNISEDIPFVGAKCFKNLVTWIQYLKPDYYLTFNSETEREIQEIELLSSEGFKVLALGKFASIRLTDRNIQHYVLPHPSPRNLQINSKKLILARLKDAYIYLRTSP